MRHQGGIRLHNDCVKDVQVLAIGQEVFGSWLAGFLPGLSDTVFLFGSSAARPDPELFGVLR